MSNRCRSLLLLFLLLAVSLADQLRTQTHVRVRGSEEEKQKAEARNSAERNKAQQIVNENEKKNVEEHNKPAEAQEKKNEEFLQHCKREEKEAAVNHQKQVEQDREDQIRIDGEIEAAMAENAYDIIGGGSINIDSSPKEIQASYEKTTNNFPPPQLRSAEDSAELLKVQKAYDTLNDPVSKSAYDATFDQVSGQVQGILHMCNHPFHAAKDHVDCSRLATSTPTIYTYDLLAWDVYQTSFNAIPSALHYNNTKPLPKETIALLTYPTAIPKCWSIIKQCIPNIEHFTPAEALTEEMKDGSNPDEQQNQGLGPLLKSFGLIDMLDAKLETLTLESLLPKDLKGMAPMLENIVGPRKMYDLNVKPLLENTNSLWGERLFDQVCGFFPGLLPPIAPREVESKFGPHLLIPQLPLLPNTIRFPIGEITLTKEGGLHISKPMYEMLLNFGPMLPGVKVMGTEMKLDMALKMICNNGNCPASLASMIVQLIPGDLFNELTKEVTSFHDVINFLIDKYTGGKIKLGENVPLPPPLSYLWGEGLLQKTGPKSCTLSAFPMQNTLEYHYDDPVLVEQYCNLANYVWCNGKPNECTREGGAIFAHATGALTLLKGLELGVCNPQMKINMIDAPLKGISLLELLHRRDEIWCVNQQKDKYFDAFFNDIKQVTPVCGNTLGDFVKRFGTSIGGLLTTIGSSFKETSLSMIASPATTSTTATTANLAPTNPATTAKTAKETMKQFHKNQKTDDAVLALIDTMDTNNVYQLHSRSHNEQQAFIHLFHNLPATKNGKASVNNKNDLMKSFSLLEQKHKLHAISLFRRLDIEEQKRHLPVGEYMDEEAETAMQAIDLRKWSQKDQQMLIEMFEQEVLHKESRDEKKIKLIKEQEQEQKLKAFTGTTSPSKKTAPALLRRRRSLLSMRNTAGRVVKRRGWFKKAAKAVVGVVKSVVNFVVPAIKSAASWINENAIQPTVQFVKKYVIEPAANFLNNCIQFFKGLVSFNPRETIAGVVRNVICGKSEVAHKIAWGTSNANVAELDLGLIDKAITDGVSKIQEFMEDHFNDPNFGVQLEEILNHMKKLSPSQMSKTTLSATAKKHTLGVHCGASYLGLPLPMAPEVNIFQNLWTPNILKDVVRFVDANVNKNSILMSVKSAIGSCGATMVVDKAFPWMMKAIPGLAQCIPTIIEPFLNEDNTNGIGETRSCGDSSIYGDQKASILAAKTSFVEMDEKDCGLRCFHPLPPNFELSQADYEKQEKQKQQEKENIQKEGASKIIDEDEAATQEAAGGRCLPQVAHEDDACINLATQELCEAAGTGGGTGTGTGTDASLMQVEEQSVPPMSAQHYAKLNEEATQKAAAETTLNCRWQAIEQSDIVFPKSLPDVREYALEQEEHLKSQRQKELEEECNVEYVPDSGPTSSNGGFNPMILAKEGFSTFPSSPKYISNCNYINTMGVSGNDPQKGCAPHCWMGFRMLELAKMRKNLPVPPIPPSGFGNRQPLDLPPQKAEEEEDPVGAEQETESGAAAWTPDPACIMVNDPYTQAGYYGYIVDIDQFTDAKEISNGIRELANLLAMIDMHPSIPAEAKDILKTCEPRLKTVLRDWMMPKCNARCETTKPCKSWCTAYQKDCMNHPAVTDMLNDVLESNSAVRNMAVSMMGKHMKVVDIVVKKLLTCGGSNGITFDVDPSSMTCATAHVNNHGGCKPSHGMKAPGSPTTNNNNNNAITTTTPTMSGRPMTGTQEVMGGVVETAIDQAKSDVESLISDADDAIIEQETLLAGKLSNAEEGLVGSSDPEFNRTHDDATTDDATTDDATTDGTTTDDASTSVLPGQQQMIGGMVEGQVNKAKGDIEELMPKVEEEIVKQEESMQHKLMVAEQSLVGTSDPAMNATTKESTLTNGQKMIGSMVESQVDKAKGQIDELIPKVEEKILEQEEELETQLSKAEESLVNNATQPLSTGPPNANTSREDLLYADDVNPKDYLPPAWHKDVVIDEEAGVAMRMLDNKPVTTPL